MKTKFPFIVALLGILLVGNICLAFTSGINSKSKLFQDYLMEGYFNNVPSAESTVTTSLSYIKAFGVTVSNETTAQSIGGTTAITAEAATFTALQGVFARASGGSILITARSSLATTEAVQPDGSWWAIGR